MGECACLVRAKDFREILGCWKGNEGSSRTPLRLPLQLRLGFFEVDYFASDGEWQPDPADGRTCVPNESVADTVGELLFDSRNGRIARISGARTTGSLARAFLLRILVFL